MALNASSTCIRSLYLLCIVSESISLSNTYYSVPSAYIPYSDGYYVYPPYQVSTDYNDLNTGFGNGGSGGNWYIGLTWGNSYFNWTYCNG